LRPQNTRGGRVTRGTRHGGAAQPDRIEAGAARLVGGCTTGVKQRPEPWAARLQARRGTRSRGSRNPAAIRAAAQFTQPGGAAARFTRPGGGAAAHDLERRTHGKRRGASGRNRRRRERKRRGSGIGVIPCRETPHTLIRGVALIIKPNRLQSVQGQWAVRPIWAVIILTAPRAAENSFHWGGGTTKMWLHLAPSHPLLLCPGWVQRPAGVGGGGRREETRAEADTRRHERRPSGPTRALAAAGRRRRGRRPPRGGTGGGWPVTVQESWVNG
jgi:hypothetical protein